MKKDLLRQFFHIYLYCPFSQIVGIFLLALSFFLFSPTAFCENTELNKQMIKKEMTLADCVFLAVRHNRSIKSAYLDRVVHKFNLKVAEDEFVPNLDITSSAKHYSIRDGETRSYTSTGNIAATVSEKIPTGADFNFTWTNIDSRTEDDSSPEKSYSSSWKATVKQPLLKGAGIDVNTVDLKTARINEKINILSLKTTISDTITSAISAYYSFVQAQKQLEITTNSVQRAKDLLDVNRALIAAGRMARDEIIQNHADVANKEFSLTQAENTLDAARLNLLQVLDIDKHTIIIPTEKIDIKPIHPDLARCKALALNNRRDYMEALLNLKIIELNLIVAKNNRFWDLSLEGAYGIIGTDEDHLHDAFEKSQNANRSEWNVGLTLTIPLYGDLTRQQAFVKAEISLKKAKLSLEKLKDTIEIEVLDAVRDVEMKL